MEDASDDRITVEMIGGPHDGMRNRVKPGCTAFAVTMIDDDGTTHFGAYERVGRSTRFIYKLIQSDPPAKRQTPLPPGDDKPWMTDRRIEGDE